MLDLQDTEATVHYSSGFCADRSARARASMWVSKTNPVSRVVFIYRV